MITIYRDTAANAIFVGDANGVQFINSLQAFMNDPADDVLSMTDLAREIDIFTDINYSEFVDSNNQPYGNDAVTVTNALNAICQSTGSAGDPPIITSPLEINTINSEYINYELIADNGVGYEWSNLPEGLSTADGNIRKLVGAITTNGVYTPTMKAVNYFGEDIQTLTINVINVVSPFSNTKSTRFNNNDYCDATANVSNPLYRPANGSGASDAWSVSFWIKTGTNDNNKQTVLSFGGADKDNDGRVIIRFRGSDQSLELKYGTENNNLVLKTNNNTLSRTQWKHVLVTYNGNATGSASGSVNDYYNAFNIFIDGVQQSTTNSNLNFGYSGSIDDTYFRLGRNGNDKDYMKDSSFIDELAIWNSDVSSNIATIYNSGTPSDLSTESPSLWYRLGDGDTFPTLIDSISSNNMIMYNMTVADIVNDVP